MTLDSFLITGTLGDSLASLTGALTLLGVICLGYSLGSTTYLFSGTRLGDFWTLFILCFTFLEMLRVFFGRRSWGLLGDVSLRLSLSLLSLSLVFWIALEVRSLEGLFSYFFSYYLASYIFLLKDGEVTCAYLATLEGWGLTYLGSSFLYLSPPFDVAVTYYKA